MCLVKRSKDMLNNKKQGGDRNDCDKSQIKMPKGYIRQIFWLGGWSLIRESTFDEYKSIKRAKQIKERGENLCSPSL